MRALARPAPLVGGELPRPPGEGGRLLRVFARNRLAVLGAVLALLVALSAAGAPLISRLDPFEQSAANRLARPDVVHVMGRDTFGRDVFARVLRAGRVSLA